MRIALVTAAARAEEAGGAEALYDGLVAALRAHTPHEVDRLDVPVLDRSFNGLLTSYLRCWELPLSGYDLVISTKAPTYAVRHPRHVSYLVHTVRVFYDAFDREYAAGTEEHHRQRRLIQHLDAQALAPPRTRRHCAVGRTAFDRLIDADPAFRAIPVTVLPHPPALTGFVEPRRGEHLLCPGRLHPWKRVDLLIKAFRRVRRDVPLKIVGRGRDEERLRRLAAGDPRIEFCGHVSEAELCELYAGAIAVPFVPWNEDYGLVTIEAFLARKPVVTCSDAGEPLRFVRERETGLVAAPDPEALARKLELVIDEPELAAAMGERGHAVAREITWERVIEGLLAGARERERGSVRTVTRAARRDRPLQILVTDNQPIEPAIGGGRLRLLGLYGTLTDGVEAGYVGSYDWPGPTRRELRLTPALTETTIPLAKETFALQAALGRLAPDRTIADVALPWLIESSPELVTTLRRRAAEADLVVVSHPWMYPAIRETVRRAGKPVIYDSHNCEALLRGDLLGGEPLGESLAGYTRFLEGLLCQEAAWILACSEDDRQSFVRLYGVPEERVRLVPNGTFVERILPAAARAPGASTRAIFVGSAFAPNEEAAHAIVTRLAPALPDVTFVLAGGVSDRVTARAANVVRLGVLSDAALRRALAESDLALNPVLRGSGVNIKMLDYLAAGLPVVTTAVGARGLDADAFVIAEIDDMAAAIRGLVDDPARRAAMGARARELAVARHDWRSISRELGELLLETAAARAAPPQFSVIVPSYQRPASLAALLARLDDQRCRDFEVVVVDQSAQPLELGAWRYRYPIRYLHTTERGAVKARNLGLRHARGQIVAFTDDDCLPEAGWLENAARYFADPAVAGVEGLVRSDQIDGERYRIVSNARGGGRYMTANLLVRRAILEEVGGFDDRFDSPHYREDTDLGWRVLALGRIPFARDVAVLHPAHDKTIARESDAERAAFFVQDALLYFKHPERYVALMRIEGHHLQTPGFWSSFEAGIARHALPVSAEELRAALSAPR